MNFEQGDKVTEKDLMSKIEENKRVIMQEEMN